MSDAALNVADQLGLPITLMKRDMLGCGYIRADDAYEAYPQYFLAQRLKSKDTKRTACLAHILRNYEAAFKQKPHFAGWYLKILGKIYQIEAALKEGKVDNETQNRYRRRYSLLISARHHGVDPEAYLREVIGRLPGCGSNEAALRELLPENWAAAHKPKQEWLFNQRQAVA